MKNNYTPVDLHHTDNLYESIAAFDEYGTSDRSGTSFNTNVGIHNPRWMSNLNDSFRISQLSIPGTHGSMARFGPLGTSLLTPGNQLTINQTMTLTTQLNAGIRYLDIRCRHHINTFPIHHGPIFQHAVFDRDVLDPIRTFLQNNPRETILMRVQEESDPEGNTRTFGQTFESYYNRYQNLFWNPTSNNPTLREVRGKIVLLQQFGGRTFGINYGSLDIQDRWELSTNFSPNGTYDKWIAIRNHFTRTMNDQQRSRIHLNHLSANPGMIHLGSNSWWPYPWFVASGYVRANNNADSEIATQFQPYAWPDYIRARSIVGLRIILFAGTNNLTTRRVRDGRINHTGIIAADFPGSGLIQGTIELNNRLMNPHYHGVYQIITALNNSSVLDLNGPNNVTIWSNNNGNHQRWIFSYDPSRNAYVIRSFSNQNLVLAWNVPSGRNVFATPFVPSYNEHYWVLERFEDGYRFSNLRVRNQVLDVSGGNTSNGTNMIVYPRHPTNSPHRHAQLFRLRRI
ncbi:phosphatidylinositol-specific phospholipase C domain-containing protein [Bacillus thuringiensis]|uniref:phosphatidylinositol-specific phospholipase C domain-containing protein n=1 Tax=Bacillus thuringiensis TaxID=1428 RepID=UPI002E192251|nr:phosphatidylinositol-specific phospholipase C domain-containing protein [Bacillus thuringiensis]